MKMTSSIRQAAFKAAIKLYPNVPPTVLALMMALIEDRGAPARLDVHGYEITESCLLHDLFVSATADRWFR